MQSCIYEGRVKHSRRLPREHRFNYRMFMMYLDLDELPGLFDKFWFWSDSRSALARFRREDHIGSADQSIASAVRDLVLRETGQRPNGPIRLLTNLAYFGHCFNPVSFYYCYSADDSFVEFIVAEVNNTPWGEQDFYVIRCSDAQQDGAPMRANPAKKMHVSPFMPMDMQYDWALTKPAQRLSVYMASSRNRTRIFDVSLQLKRTEISSGALASVLFRFPFQTAKIMFAIHWQALRLWLKGCPVYAHPAKPDKEVVKQS
jgi:DUF1365 family protein